MAIRWRPDQSARPAQNALILRDILSSNSRCDLASGASRASGTGMEFLPWSSHGKNAENGSLMFPDNLIQRRPTGRPEERTACAKLPAHPEKALPHIPGIEPNRPSAPQNLREPSPVQTAATGRTVRHRPCGLRGSAAPLSRNRRPRWQPRSSDILPAPSPHRSRG